MTTSKDGCPTYGWFTRLQSFELKCQYICCMFLTQYHIPSGRASMGIEIPELLNLVVNISGVGI